MDQLKQHMAQRGLGDYFERMKHLARNAIHVEPIVTPEDQIPVGASKFGGKPDLPEGFVWPRQEEGKPLLFLCQFNLAELAPYDRDGRLPKEGLLSFFYDVIPMPDFFLYMGDGWKVFYHVGQELKRQRGPEDLLGYFNPARIAVRARMELPFRSGDIDSEVCTKLLGHACVYGYGGAETVYQSIQKRFYGPDDPNALENAHRWINLLQLDSHRDVGWYWEDGYGRVYFWIEEDDLKNCCFDRVIAITASR